MKKTIRRADGTVEELQGSPGEIREYEGMRDAPVLVPTPFVAPGTFGTSRFEFVPADQPCAVEEAFKRDPNQILGLVCSCPRCSPRFATTIITTTAVA